MNGSTTLPAIESLIRELDLRAHPEGGYYRETYLGGPLEIYELDEQAPDAPPRVTTLGTRFDRGERPQHVVPAGRWFGAEPAPGSAYPLVGCTVAPGFEVALFELGDGTRLSTLFPAAGALISRLT